MQTIQQFILETSVQDFKQMKLELEAINEKRKKLDDEVAAIIGNIKKRETKPRDNSDGNMIDRIHEALIQFGDEGATNKEISLKTGIDETKVRYTMTRLITSKRAETLKRNGREKLFRALVK